MTQVGADTETGATNPNANHAGGSGTITLLTDFGYRDPFVGVMKGVILRQCPRVSLVDLTHGIEPQQVEAAAFWLEQVWPYFAQGTVHLVVVDPGVGSRRRAIAAAAHDQLFVAPDNGVLSWVLASDPRARVVELSARPAARTGRTFDGRDLFAPLAARLSAGAALSDLGTDITDWVRLDQPQAVREGATVRGRIILADHFGNLITNVRPGPDDTVLGVSFQGQELPWGTSYADVQLGECVALLNSWGYVELSVRQGSAKTRFAAGSDTEVLVTMRN